MEHRILALIRQAADPRSDADLVAAREDHGAFRELVARHGPMVWGVCRQMLRDADAEDAFQAAFVALLKADLRDRTAVAPWLYATAVRIALMLRREAGRRRNREQRAACPEAFSPGVDDWADTMEVVHREVAALPETDRAAFVLCVLKGLTQEEASARLGRTPGAVAGQVARAKRRLVARLSRRGIVPGLAALTAGSVAEAVPPTLADRVLRQPVELPATVVRLAKGVLGMSTSIRQWMLTAGVLGVMFVGLGLYAATPPSGNPAPAANKPDEPVPAKAAEGRRTWKGKLSEKGTGRPIAGADISIAITADENRAKNQARLDRTVKLKSAADGSYEFAITPKEAARQDLYLKFTITAPDHTEYIGGYGYSLLLRNETLGQRPFFEHIALWPGRPIEGVVKTPDGKPASGIMVVAFTDPGHERFDIGRWPETKTDDQGRFRLMLYAEGKAVFWILPRDFAPELHGVAADRKGDLGAFTLARGERLAGKLLDSRGKPVAGVYVEAKAMEEKSDVIPDQVADLIRRATVTAADGSFEFRPLPAGTYEVTPTETGDDPMTTDRKYGPQRRALPAVFLPRQAVLKAGVSLDPVVIRAVPHVALEVHWLGSKGEKMAGEELIIIGRIGNRSWIHSSIPKKGVTHLLVPRGLSGASLALIHDSDSAIQYRLKKDGPLQYTRSFRLGTLDEDNKEIEIIRYAAPTIMMSATTKDGKPINDFYPSVDYTDPNYHSGKIIFKKKSRSDVPFEQLPGGRIRTIQLVPDREVRVTVAADGFKPASRTITLKEGKAEDIKFELEPK